MQAPRALDPRTGLMPTPLLLGLSGVLVLPSAGAERAVALLRRARGLAGLASRRYREAVEERLWTLSEHLERFASANPEDDPSTLFTADDTRMCQVCHRSL